MNIAFVSDINAQGSGYMSLSLPICDGLARRGHKVLLVGLGNDGKEHNFPFSIYPAKDLNEALLSIQNLQNFYRFEVLFVALDIPLQELIIRAVSNRPFKYVGIFPIEADPLCMSWAMSIMSMDKQYVISEFGTKEAHKRGIMNAEHIVVGIDTDLWKVPTAEERQFARETFGVEEDEFVVLTVADNQERKNLWRNFEAFVEFLKGHPKSKYFLVTREHNAVGWKLRELAQEMGFGHKLLIFERGMSFKELWNIYAASDVYLNLAKAEGLGLGALESMAVGIPVIQTNCTAMMEICADGRGYLVPYEYRHRDCFGNGWRYWAKAREAAKHLTWIYDNRPDTSASRAWVENRKWSNAIDQIERYLAEVKKEKDEQAKAQAATATAESNKTDNA